MKHEPEIRGVEGEGAPRFVECRACPLRLQRAFRPKEPDEVDLIRSLKIGHRRLGAGAEIIAQGESEADLYTLFAGWAFRSRTLADGRRQILNFLLPGDLIGLQAHLLEAADHAVEAITEVELCQFSRKRIWSLFERAPAFAYELAWLGAREENIVDDNLTSVGQRSARERMAALLLSLDRRCRQLGLVSDGSFAFPLTRAHLADALGLSVVHTIKTWSHLRRIGLIGFADGRLSLLNPRLTERWAQAHDREWRPRPLL